MTDLLLRRVSESRPGADNQDDYDVIGTDGLVIGRIFKAVRFPNGSYAGDWVTRSIRRRGELAFG